MSGYRPSGRRYAERLGAKTCLRADHLTEHRSVLYGARGSVWGVWVRVPIKTVCLSVGPERSLSKLLFYCAVLVPMPAAREWSRARAYSSSLRVHRNAIGGAPRDRRNNIIAYSERLQATAPVYRNESLIDEQHRVVPSRLPT